MNWLLNTLRFTAFSSQPVGITWKEVAGTEPELRVEEPSNGSRLEEGAWGSGRLLLKQDPTRLRVDLVLQAAEPQGMETLGPATDLLREFIDFIGGSPILKMTAMNRIAIGLIALVPVETRRVGYVMLKDLLRSVTLYPDDTSDFSYQINYPRDSTSTPGLVLNRLSKWSVAAQQQVMLQLAGLGQGQPIVRTTYAARMELDYNTAYSPTPLMQPQAIVAELTNDAVSTLANGEPIVTRTTGGK